MCTCYIRGYTHSLYFPNQNQRGEGGGGVRHTHPESCKASSWKELQRARVSPQTSGLPMSPLVTCQLGSRGEPGRRWVRVRSANTLRVHSTFLSTHTGWLTTAVFQGSNGLSGVHGHCIYLVTLREHAINLATLERSIEFRGRRLSCFTRLAALWPSAGRHSWPTRTPDLSVSACSWTRFHLALQQALGRWQVCLPLTFPMDSPFT